MARIDKSALTKAEIISEATKQFLEKGYSHTSVSAIAKQLKMSPGNLTFHYPTKEHLLAQRVDILCDFQWKAVQQAVEGNGDAIRAICLELTTMASACEDDPIIKDFLLSSYCSSVCLDIIRKNDTERSKIVYGCYRPDWSDEHFSAAEILVSGIEYATLMVAGNPVPLETRLHSALQSILTIYGVPEEVRNAEIDTVFAMDYRDLCKQVLKDFKKHVAKTNDQVFRLLLKG